MSDRINEMEEYYGVPLNLDFTTVPGKVIITKAEDKDEEDPQKLGDLSSQRG